MSATVFWFLNALNKRYTTSLTLPVHFAYEDNDLVVVKPPPEFLRINLTGIGWDLFRRKNWLFRTPPLVINLTAPAETKFFSNDAARNMINSQLRPLRLNYLFLDSLQLDIQARKSRTIKVRFDTTTLRYATNCRPLAPYRLSTDTFTLTGAQHYVEAFPEEVVLGLGPFDAPLDETIEQLSFPLVQEHLEVLQAYPAEGEAFFEVARFERHVLALPIERLHFPNWSRTQIVLDDTLVELGYWVAKDSARWIVADSFAVGVDYRSRNRKERLLFPALLRAPGLASDFTLTPTELRFHYERRR